MKKQSLVLLSALLLCAGFAQADALKDGSTAFEKKDYTSALRNFKIAAEEGNQAALYNLGVMYDEGMGVKKDYVEAAKWYLMAAEKGVSGAQYNLASMYRKGDGVAQNEREAIKWLKLAAEQGDAEAQADLGSSYDNDKSDEKDRKNSYMWLTLAVNSGVIDAVHNRQKLEKKMKPEHIVEAKKMATACINHAFKACELKAL